MSQDSTVDENIYMLKCFRPRLIQTIQIAPVLDYLYSLDNEIKMKLKNTASTSGNQEAVRLLLNYIEDGPRQAGWFDEFAMALREGECTQAELYVNPETLPSPSLEAKYDICEKLVNVLYPELVKTIDPLEVSERCFKKKICSQEDKDMISAEVKGRGPIPGARELLSRITQKKDWFLIFVGILREMGYQKLVENLTGGTCEESTENNGTSQPLEAVEDSKNKTNMDKPSSDVHKTKQEPENSNLTSDNSALEASFGESCIESVPTSRWPLPYTQSLCMWLRQPQHGRHSSLNPSTRRDHCQEGGKGGYPATHT
ncbi:hypothetical protein FKM82_017301 [Ascaphus truei]